MPQPFLVRSGSDLGRAVSEARRASGLTQTEFAAKMGLDQAYLARLERGHSVQLLDRAIRALRALDADLIVSIPDSHDAD
ncbi:MAG: helix-turn-helix domain-containing protein [Candidatus Nanopelagicales bacterium]|nr:helix-turn-helix domain-containing protein [Candidatus Nanopelagicales bacterium]MCF8541945.1 helix-turn-helix domain-containing protein [Candidatus Nanopelagicales bacterium]MCF8556574.1 helix-turn-helix domain-containing protein [Candidatus Nanopelagicales bacterium]